MRHQNQGKYRHLAELSECHHRYTSVAVWEKAKETAMADAAGQWDQSDPLVLMEAAVMVKVESGMCYLFHKMYIHPLHASNQTTENMACYIVVEDLREADQEELDRYGLHCRKCIRHLPADNLQDLHRRHCIPELAEDWNWWVLVKFAMGERVWRN